jgi:hypothetical protein
MAGRTYHPKKGALKMMAVWGQFYKEWRLGNVQSGRTSVEANLALLDHFRGQSLTKEECLPWSRVKGGTFVCFSGWAALRGEQCDMMPWNQNLGIREMSQRCPFLSNIAHKSLWLPHMHAIVKELLGQCFLVSPQPSDMQTACELTEESVIRAWNLATCLWWHSQQLRII